MHEFLCRTLRLEGQAIRAKKWFSRQGRPLQFRFEVSGGNVDDYFCLLCNDGQLPRMGLPRVLSKWSQRSEPTTDDLTVFNAEVVLKRDPIQDRSKYLVRNGSSNSFCRYSA